MPPLLLYLNQLMWCHRRSCTRVGGVNGTYHSFASRANVNGYSLNRSLSTFYSDGLRGAKLDMGAASYVRTLTRLSTLQPAFAPRLSMKSTAPKERKPISKFSSPRSRTLLRTA
jgi:hypothetical protein